MTESPKYALPEIERRWLVEPGDRPRFPDSDVTVIDDLYLTGTRMRLRRMTPGEVWKLGKKYGGDGLVEPITNLYLTEAEFARFAELPGARLRKRRVRIEGGSLDVIDALGVCVFEREFDSVASAQSYDPPVWVGREVTFDPAWSGAALAALVSGSKSMSGVDEHYDRHLGPVYAWMVGGAEGACARGAAELDQLGLLMGAGKRAVDLGAGFGMHALPLAERGYSVTAIDRCAHLIGELRERAGELPLEAVVRDVVGFEEHVPDPVDAILCMGDTLPHLPSAEAVEQVLAAAAKLLAQGGLLVVTFRDLFTEPRRGNDRFLQVRADQHRILTCFLEEVDAATVRVHDLLQERASDDAPWELRVSSYPKLRLDPDEIVSALGKHGLSVMQEPGAAGMVRILARRDA